MPTCTSCKTKRAARLFVAKTGKLTKMCGPCRARGAAKFRKQYAKNAEGVHASTKKWRNTNPAAHRRIKKAADVRYRERNPEYVRRKNQRYRERYPAKNLAKVNAYRARKLKATPKWADTKAIEQIYALAQLQAKLSGKVMHVDHEVPLKHKLVCGLHVPGNLQIVSGGYNSRKCNHKWQDMP